MKLGTIAELTMLVGVILIAIAGFTISLTVGLFLSGISLIGLGVLFFLVHLSNVTKDRGGGK